MELKKNKFIIFCFFNIALLLIILFLAIPISKFFNKISLNDNEFVKNQAVINPDAKSSKIIDRTMQIKFIAKVDDLLNWDFKVLEDKINIKVGENKTISYEGINLSNRIITSTANFTASPESISPYLIKIECFCFKEQTLKPGETKTFNMVFFLDPSLDSDSNLNDLKELVFTYEFSEYKS